jgi:hypothetical protein
MERDLRHLYSYQRISQTKARAGPSPRSSKMLRAQPHRPQRDGNYQVPLQAGPILDVEFSGITFSFGDSQLENERIKIGEEVFGLAYGGKPLSIPLFFLVAD